MSAPASVETELPSFRDEAEGRVFFRSLSDPKTRIRAVGENTGVYEVRLTTDDPVEVWPGVREILGHEPGEVRMDWLRSGNAPVLWMHDRKDGHIGVIESAMIRDRGIFMTVRLAKEGLGAEKRGHIDDGILRNTSVGFRIHQEERVESTDEADTWRVTDWSPLEGSFVTIPADMGTGFGRAADKSQLSEAKQRALEACSPDFTKPNQPIRTMPAEAPPAESEKPQVRTIEVVKEPDPQEVERAVDKKLDAELTRRDAIAEQGQRFSMPEATIEKAIKSGSTIEDFRAAILEDFAGRTKGVTTEEIGLTTKEKKRFSVFRIMEALSSGKRGLAEFEDEVSDEVKKRNGRADLNTNFALPADVAMRDQIRSAQARAYLRGESSASERALFSASATGDGEAGSIIDNELQDQMFIESLREDTVFLQRGVTMLAGLRGDVTIPIELTNPSVYWVGEDAEPTEGAYTLDALALTFKTVAGRVPFTRQAFKQTTPQIEDLLVRSMRRSVRIELDRASINGAGSATEPEGVLNATGIGSVTTSGTVTYAHLMELEEALGDANAPTGRAQGFTNTHGKRILLETFKKASGGTEITLGSRVAGEENALDTDIGRFYIGNTVPRNLGAGTDKTAMIYGNPAAYFMGMWGGLELNIDLATKVATGGRVVRVFQDVDGRVMQAANFAAAVDIT